MPISAPTIVVNGAPISSAAAPDSMLHKDNGATARGLGHAGEHQNAQPPIVGRREGKYHLEQTPQSSADQPEQVGRMRLSKPLFAPIQWYDQSGPCRESARVRSDKAPSAPRLGLGASGVA
jgi:hypothetical protein